MPGLGYYFARPHHSLVRERSEHTNCLERQHCPKWKEFKHLPEEEVWRVQGLLNDRPRKALGYHMPNEASSGRARRERGTRAGASALREGVRHADGAGIPAGTAESEESHDPPAFVSNRIADLLPKMLG